MKLNLYSLFDRKMNIYLAPFPSRHPVEAMRSIRDGANQPGFKDTPVGAYPADFDLYFVATFDDDSGKVGCPMTPELIGNIEAIITGGDIV